jgi:hypothetical protein
MEGTMTTRIDTQQKNSAATGCNCIGKGISK